MEGMLENLDYKTDREIIESIKRSLLGGKYDAVTNIFSSDETYLKSLDDLLRQVYGVGIDILGDAYVDLYNCRLDFKTNV
jgi:hypothetical protein